MYYLNTNPQARGARALAGTHSTETHRAALERYPDLKGVQALIRADRHSAAVEAFAAATAGINNLETVLATVTVGPSRPSRPENETFLRRLVRSWDRLDRASKVEQVRYLWTDATPALDYASVAYVGYAHRDVRWRLLEVLDEARIGHQVERYRAALYAVVPAEDAGLHGLPTHAVDPVLRIVAT